MASTSKGHIQRLPSGSFRVKVYAGTDPVTGKERLLRQTCPDEAAAHAALGRLLAEADGGRFPDRQATLGQALDKYLEVADLEVSTREAHEGYIRRTIRPVLGEVRLRKLGADSLDSLYTALKKCSRLCGRLPRTEHYADGSHACDGRCGPLRDHRTTRPHVCDDRCRPHACRPMKPATILRIHSIISSALDLAVRYDWADRNVAKNARPPHPRKREPDPPSPEQAARLLNLVWAEDEEFGLYLWTAFTTGARRGEVSALREKRRVVFALREVPGRGIGHRVHWVVDPLISHTVVTVTTPLSVLPYRPSHCRPTCAVFTPSLRSPLSSTTSSPAAVRRRRRITGQHLQPAVIDPARIPPRLREEELQPLHRRMLRPGHRLSPHQRRQRLVPVPRRQQTGQVLPEPPPLR
jgi:hypothetical protein